MIARVRRALLALTLLVVAICGAIGGGQIVARSQQKALAINALPPVERQHVCAEGALAGETLHHAGVVIVFPEGTDTYCVSFEEDELSGAELLQRTGLQLVLSGFGGLGSGVCQIDDVGCRDPGDCFCQCRGAGCHYWTYYELDGDAWRALPVGASTRRVHDGDVDGWVWGNGHTSPDPASIGALCSAVRPTALPTATPVRANTGGGRATATPQPRNNGATPGNDVVEQSTVAARAATPPSAAGPTEVIVTPEPRVVRQSSRPTREVASVRGDAPDDGGGGLPGGLLAFGAVAGGLVVIAGGLVARRGLRG